MENSAIIYPNLASAEQAEKPVTESDLTEKEKEAYKLELAKNMEPVPES